ncbi:MAG: HAD family hydrolase [Acidobacteria bacterium]|nr:HAD family hydrolase [Acidobacteriota bacterium]MBK8149028.1 HAD family hydrolase [Acidobacteriota bacterium]MBK8811613.1 HAD family hydrolase [Acidobacteriota bacterium]
MKETKGQKTVFLDRDGTLIQEVNFLHRLEDLSFFDYTDEAVRRLKQAGFLVVIVTNQSGIGRGIYTADDMHAIHDRIQDELSEKLDAFYFCPHLPDAGCACRKPQLGMIEQAATEFAIDLANSWMVGDKLLDVQLGFNAGIRTAMVKTGYGIVHGADLEREPDIIAENLLEVVAFILESDRD